MSQQIMIQKEKRGERFYRAVRDGERPVHGYTSSDGRRCQGS